MGTEVPARGGRRTSVPVFLILALLLLGAPPLKATEENSWDLDIDIGPGLKTAIALGFIAELTLDVSSLVFAVGNMRDERPSSTWINGGYICGGLNIFEGVVVLAISGSFEDKDVAYGFGIIHLAMGALNIGLSYWSSTKPEEGSPRISLSPMVLVDRDGSPAVGVGLQVMNW